MLLFIHRCFGNNKIDDNFCKKIKFIWTSKLQQTAEYYFSIHSQIFFFFISIRYPDGAPTNTGVRRSSDKKFLASAPQLIHGFFPSLMASRNCLYPARAELEILYRSTVSSPCSSLLLFVNASCKIIILYFVAKHLHDSGHCSFSSNSIHK